MVDDVEINRELAFHIMVSWGCLVDVAADGATGLEKLRKVDYDLVLMDIQMPVMDGVEATRQVRRMSDPGKSTVPVVALTANLDREDHRVYAEAGMDDCLSKPFTEPELLAVVQKNVREKAGAGERGSVGGKQVIQEHATVINGGSVSAPGSMVSPAVGTAEKAVSAKTVAAGNAEPLYSLSLVAAISGGDQGFVANMLKLFLETVPGTLAGLESAAGEGNWPVAGKLAHKLKSTVDSMGIASLKEKVRKLEKDAQQGGDPEDLMGLTREIVDTMHEVMVRVKEDHEL